MNGQCASSASASSSSQQKRAAAAAAADSIPYDSSQDSIPEDDDENEDEDIESRSEEGESIAEDEDEELDMNQAPRKRKKDHDVPVDTGNGDHVSWSSWSNWSTCSRTCDGGVMQQIRRCQIPNGCRGQAVRYRICNMQTCPEQQDFRARQCSAYDDVPYDGTLYKWTPHYDYSEPCALTCKYVHFASIST